MDYRVLFLVSLLLLASSSRAEEVDQSFIQTNDLQQDQEQPEEPKDNPNGRNLDFDILDSDYFDEPPLPEETVEPEVVKKKASCLGCPNDLNVEDEKIENIARFALTKLLAGEIEDGVGGIDNMDMAPTFLKVLKAQMQIVSGVKYILDVELGWTNCTRTQYSESPNECGLDSSKDHSTCSFHVVEKAWQSTMDVLHADCNPTNQERLDDDAAQSDTEDEDLLDEYVEEEKPVRKRRNAKNFGLPVEESESDKVLEIAKFAIEQLDHFDEDDKARVLVDIINARKQTVSGWLFHLKLRIAQTSCKEETNATLETCGDSIEYPYQKCEVKVLVQPWQLVQRKLVQSQCYPENSKKSRKLAKSLGKNSIEKERKKIGGVTILDPNAKEIEEIVSFAVESVDSQSNSLNTLTPVRVIYAERQLASGIRTKIAVEVGYTNCRKGHATEKSQCVLDEERSLQVCNITILEKPWLNEKNIVSYKCGKHEEILYSRRKRETGEDEKLFGEFKEKYGKNYESEEEHLYRLEVFKDNMKKVKLLQDSEQGTATYGATQFADLTEEEFSTRFLGLRVDLKQRMKRKQARIPILPKIPDEFDWRSYNAVTPVKNQGMCGSCWAFSVTGNIEGAYAIKHNQLLSFSEQELVDCDKLDEGCNGGLPENAYKSIEKLGGLETESQYPYNGHGKQCRFNSDLVKAKVTSFVEVSKNETDMVNFLLKNGPISIGINANAMQFYFGGISHPWKFLCSPKNLDHGVLIVGYGVHTSSIRHKTLPYWIIKNSWGTSWGEKGYYRVYRGDGTCGVNQMATSAFVA